MTFAIGMLLVFSGLLLTRFNFKSAEWGGIVILVGYTLFFISVLFIALTYMPNGAVKI